MTIKKIINKLLHQSNFKVKIDTIQNSEDFDYVYNRIINIFSITKDYAYFLKNYDYISLSVDNFTLGIAGIPLLIDDLNEGLFKEMFRISVLDLSLDKLDIYVYFDLKLTNIKGIYYSIIIYNKSTTEFIESKIIYLLPDFQSFLIKIPEIVTNAGIQKLITAANLNYDIDKTIAMTNY